MSNIKLPVVIANWKMNPISRKEAIEIFNDIKIGVKKISNVEVIVAPPALYISEIKKLSAKSLLLVGAQNVHNDIKGAHTGELSTAQLAEVGVSHIIIGHSERRAMGESEDFIAKKIFAVIKAKLVPILCVGERERDPQANFYSIIETQIKSALVAIPKGRIKDVVIAYEPIWAIGTGAVASVSDVQEMNLFIKKILIKLYDRPTANRVKIIYGGSVSEDNANELHKGAGLDGFLVGGASLRPAEFIRIVTFVSK